MKEQINHYSVLKIQSEQETDKSECDSTSDSTSNRRVNQTLEYQK